MPGSIESLIDLYDSEILQVEKVVMKLNEKQGQTLPLESFRKEIIERFAEIGLVVSVAVYDTTVDGVNPLDGVYSFVAQIEGRTDKLDWDPDRQVHEVRTDILDLLPNSEKGQWIKSSGLVVPEGHAH